MPSFSTGYARLNKCTHFTAAFAFRSAPLFPRRSSIETSTSDRRVIVFTAYAALLYPPAPDDLFLPNDPMDPVLRAPPPTPTELEPLRLKPDPDDTRAPPVPRLASRCARLSSRFSSFLRNAISPSPS